MTKKVIQGSRHNGKSTLFEKEAKERARKLEESQTLGVYDNDEDLARDRSWNDGEVVGYEQGFQQGAEFGYNKANEWHYPSKGEYPKDDKNMLMSEHLILLTKMKGTDNLNISLGQYNFSTQEFSYQHIVGLTDVIAWKEIKLPKESE